MFYLYYWCLIFFIWYAVPGPLAYSHLRAFLKMYLIFCKGFVDIEIVIIGYFSDINARVYIAVLHLRCCKQKIKSNYMDDDDNDK
jgi:hypothetical protein